ncbi:interactor of constitutive active ROPs 1 isoform X2 [Musa acuminata AAA Group]|uniref:interactor of constitutive active ROPs 1 isoform X2 n=1 Tax=Musa acuminata AAA Group TaxID=214697 RepID=UPI0031D7250C
MSWSRGSDLHQQQSPRAPLHLKTSVISEANILHRMVVDRSPKLEDGRSPRSPLHEKKRSTRVADLETKLSKAQEELKKLRDQLGSAEVAKVDAEQALEKAKKQVFSVNRNSELDKQKPLPQESEPASEPKPQPAPKSEVEDVSSSTASDVSTLAVQMEPLGQVKHEEEAEKEKDEQNMEIIMKKDDDNNIGGGVVERNELVDLPESPEEVKLKYMILKKEKEVEFLLEENMSFKRRAEEEAENLAADARAKEEELKAKISSMEEELKESRARAAHLMEQLAAAEGAKATLEVEMKRLRVQTGQWRKAAEAATALVAAGDRAATEMGGKRVAERCRSMDGHHGGFDGWDLPLVGGESEQDGVVGGRRKSAGIWMFGDLWKKRLQQR